VILHPWTVTLRHETHVPVDLPSALVYAVCAIAVAPARSQVPRVRARDLGVTPGIFSPGALNAITVARALGIEALPYVLPERTRKKTVKS